MIFYENMKRVEKKCLRHIKSSGKCLVVMLFLSSTHPGCLLINYSTIYHYFLLHIYFNLLSGFIWHILQYE